MNVLATADALNQKAAQTGSSHFCDPTLAFIDPVHARFLSLWRSKAGKRAMPTKLEMTPRDLKDFLPHIVICQRVAEKPSRYVWRLVGTKVSDVVGNITGTRLDESAPSELVARWIECLDMVLGGRQPLRFLGQVYLRNREYLDAENQFVPLTNDEGQPTFVMGLCRYTARSAKSA